MSDIYYGGDIVTLAQAERGAPRPEAVLVAHGRVRALGTLAQLRALDGGAFAVLCIITLPFACLGILCSYSITKTKDFRKNQSLRHGIVKIWS